LIDDTVVFLPRLYDCLISLCFEHSPGLE
jgi:hypothetical protein